MKKNQKICFLAYEPRSGSTILSKYLTEHYNVFVVPECNFIIELLTRYSVFYMLEDCDKQYVLDLIASDRKLNDWGISQDLNGIVTFERNLLISNLITKIIVLLTDKFAANSILVLKKESYSLVFNQITKIIKDAKFFYIVRDPRAVYASQKNSIYTKTGQPFSKSCVKTAMSWNLQLKRSNQILRGGSDTKFIKYEDFVVDPKITTQRFGFDPIEITNDIAHRYVVPQKYNKLHANVGKPPNVGSIDKWRIELNLLETILIELFCYKYMKKWGYATSTVSDFLNRLGIGCFAQLIQSVSLNVYRKISKLPWSKNMLFLEPD